VLDCDAAVQDPYDLEFLLDMSGSMGTLVTGGATRWRVLTDAVGEFAMIVAAHLTKLFADFDTSAVSFAEENQASLRPAFDVGTWEQFLRMTHGFAFAEAQALLDGAVAHLPAS
jgi:hypothetical protein